MSSHIDYLTFTNFPLHMYRHSNQPFHCEFQSLCDWTKKTPKYKVNLDNTLFSIFWYNLGASSTGKEPSIWKYAETVHFWNEYTVKKIRHLQNVVNRKKNLHIFCLQSGKNKANLRVEVNAEVRYMQNMLKNPTRSKSGWDLQMVSGEYVVFQKIWMDRLE